MARLKDLASSPPDVRRNVLRRVGQVVSFLVLIALLLFLSAGSIAWLYAWVYLALYALVMLIGSLLLPLEVIAERGSKKENVEPWDRVLVAVIIVPDVSLYLVAGLDVRWGWTPSLAVGWHLAAIGVFLAGCALMYWAMIVNRFFSTAVRIQFERGQSVCSSGPYRYIRHPGYLGTILYTLASPILLGSLWAMLPAAVVAGLFVVRTWLEDNTLRHRLAGYGPYVARVRYRLLPGIW
jgi:protein-S-isoprenylcysteine O-methyltransferase Ste14